MIAEVIINTSAKELDKTFDYNVPISMKQDIKIGSKVLIPFGKMKKLEEGYVINFKENSQYKVKDIAKIEEANFLNENKIKLAKWIAKKYFCNMSEAIKLMLPPGTTTKIVQNRIKEKREKFVALNIEDNEIKELIGKGNIKSDKHIKVLTFLINNKDVMFSELLLYTDVSRAIVKTLEKNGYIKIFEKQVERNSIGNKVVKQNNKLVFNSEQELAYKKIETAINNKINSEFLIFGVTGSRKNRNIFANYRKSFK